jgi:hypothetical protein
LTWRLNHSSAWGVFNAWIHVFNVFNTEAATVPRHQRMLRWSAVGGAVTRRAAIEIVCDDPNNTTEVESDTVREPPNDWLDVVISTRASRHRAVPPSGLE